VPSSTGWKNTAPIRVQTSDSTSNSPMLAVPGWLDSQRPPHAVAVVAALRMMAWVSGCCSSTC
jgi:hypothetical protein